MGQRLFPPLAQLILVTSCVSSLRKQHSGEASGSVRAGVSAGEADGLEVGGRKRSSLQMKVKSYRASRVSWRGPCRVGICFTCQPCESEQTSPRIMVDHLATQLFRFSRSADLQNSHRLLHCVM